MCDSNNYLAKAVRKLASVVSRENRGELQEGCELIDYLILESQGLMPEVELLAVKSE
jgi:hypothetical protein